MSSEYSPELLDRLGLDPAWSLIEGVIDDVLIAWVAVEDGDLRKADETLRAVVASLRSRRGAIEARERV